MALTDLPPTRAAPVNVIEATRAAYSELRKSERKVADVLVVIDILSTAVALRRGEEHQERFRKMSGA
jgi:DNA-binding MurR/RpiR family transcriptional regulator